MEQRITLYKGFYRHLPVTLVKWDILGSSVLYVLDHSMALRIESASVSSLPVRNPSTNKSKDPLKNRERSSTPARTQISMSFAHVTLCWGKEVHISVEKGNTAVIESLEVMQDWMNGAKLTTNGTVWNRVAKETFRPISYVNHLNAEPEIGANAKLGLDDVQAIVEQQDKAWLSFMDSVYMLGEHVSVNNDVSHIRDWDAVVCLHSTSVLFSPHPHKNSSRPRHIRRYSEGNSVRHSFKRPSMRNESKSRLPWMM